MKRPTKLYPLVGVVYLLLFINATLLQADSCVQLISSPHLSDTLKRDFLETTPYRAYIVQRGSYEALRLGNFKTFKEAEKARQYYHQSFPDAYIIKNCKESHIIADNQDRISQKSSTPFTAQKESPSQSPKSDSQESFVEVESSIVTFQDIVHDPKPLIAEKFDVIDFKRYLQVLLKEDENVDSEYYYKKLAEIETLIQQDAYNSNVELTVLTSARRSIAIDQTLTRDLRLSSRLSWSKRLYDGAKGYLHNQNQILKERDASLRYKRAKEQLALTGAELYDNCLYSQLAIAIYEKFYEMQKKTYAIVHNRVLTGLGSPVDEIDAKNDLIGIKKQLLTQKFEHRKNLYLFRSSINFKSEKIPFFKWWHIQEPDLPNSVEEELFFHKNLDLAIADNNSKLQDLNYLIVKSSKLPEVNSYASYGYDIGKDTLTLSGNGLGTSYNWEVGIRLTLPIYRRNDIYLQTQKAKIEAIIEKNKRKKEFKRQRDLYEIDRDEIELYKKHYKLVEQQYHAQLRKMQIILRRYLDGKGYYRDYSDALNEASTMALQLITDKIRLIERILYQHYLIGNTLYDETY